MTTEKRIADAASHYPLAAEVCSGILEQGRNLLAKQIAYQAETHGEAFWEEAQRLVALSQSLGGKPVEAILEYTLAYLKEQAAFVATGEYSNDSFDTVNENVYSNPDVMLGFYLDGLMLSHAFWPIHFDMHKFYRREFLSRVPDAGVGAEFGFGHGLYLHDLLLESQERIVHGYDISEHAIQFAGRLLAQAGLPEHRYQLNAGNVCKPMDLASGSLRWAICAEVMEHIPDPVFSFGQIQSFLQPGAPFFITTVANSNAIDHLHLFTDISQVHDVLEQAGLQVVAEQSFAVADYAAASRDPTVDFAFVCVPQGS